MKVKKTQDTGESKPRTVMPNQAAHLATRAYELYIQRGGREGCAVEDWLEAEWGIVSREFPVSSGSGRGDSL
jgi:Protein of unknown function (DUF2934)